jgi:oligo-1,6-glucosidase/alpha-glucosidase
MDSNQDGIGDLNGILSRLDYLKTLGFETIWLSPFYSSPQQDFGYDISDYTGIAPAYGSLSDVDQLIQAVHARGMRIIFDLVLNHTSIQHPWFQQARQSRDNPRRDWYIWRDGRGKRPPNNWVAIPGGSGWHYDAATEQYYYASFLSFQPDLNWRNPQVRQAMFDVIRFWLDRGVDGFRLDIFHTIFKDAHFRDNPFSWHYIPKDDRVGFFQQWRYNLNQPEVFQLAKDLRELLASYTPERALIGEVFGSDEHVKKILGEEADGLHLVFLWDLLNLKADAGTLRKVIQHYERTYPAPSTPVYVFGNHDRKRVFSHIGEDTRIAKLLALFQFTVRGVPVTYYGEEIGMADGAFPAKNALDPIGRKYRHIPQSIINWLGLYVNRDGCRTPMQWEAGPNGGFCEPGVTPWLPVHENRQWANVASQAADDESILNTYQRVLRLRREQTVLQTGALELVGESQLDGNLLAYRRKSAQQSLLVAINFGEHPARFHDLPAPYQVLLAVGGEPVVKSKGFMLAPFSGVVIREGQ